MWRQRAAATAVLSALALGTAIGRADDGAQPQPPAGLLEFLGSVDRLSEVNPNYMSQPAATKVVARPPAASGPAKPPPPPAPVPGDKNNG